MSVQKKKPNQTLCTRLMISLQLVIFHSMLMPSAIQAQTNLSLKKAVSLTVAQHPELKSFTYMSESAQGLIQQAATSTPLSVNVGVEDALGTGSFSGISAIQSSLSISWLMEKSVVNSRIKVANQKALLPQLQRQAKVLDVASETAKIFINLLSQQAHLTLAETAQSEAQKAFKEISKRVKVGQLNMVDQLRAKANFSKKSLVVEDLVHEVEASRTQLAAQWQGDNNFTIVGNLTNIPSIQTLNQLEDKLRSTPQQKLYRIQQRVAQAEIDLARNTARPSWKITTGIRRNEAVDDIALTAGISIPFGGTNNNRGKIKALQARQHSQQAEADASIKRISTQIMLLAHQLKHNRHVVNALTQEIIPALKQAQNKASAAYQKGSYRYTDWYAVQQELLSSQAELIDAYTNIQFFNIELERLTGTSIFN